MFSDTVTMFNCVENKSQKKVYWFPTVLNNVEVQMSQGLNVIKSGNEDASTMYLNIPLIASNNELFADGVKYLKPIAYKSLNDKSESFTLCTEDDFIAVGDFSNLGTTIDDDSEDYPDGFYEYMKSHYDDVYKINTVDEYKTIRHLEVGGK